MKKLVTLIISGCLLIGTFGCEEGAKNAADTTNTPSINVKKTTTTTTTKSTDKATILPIIGADTKAKTTTDKTAISKADAELKTAISKKLATGLPGNKLVIENNNGEVIIKGTAISKAELAKAEKLVKEVTGVKSVTIEAQVKAPKKS
ncbi:BON domain-containing protein [Nostoc sp. CMAA1605]|uniref:BON domain-containing protein n=1 Tax=Nostoc sp. CMAA1605 TaxID=2055159 RepID=UPI001F20F035|nr:BON domain-containing protein [Nostoc sp. CMAA1605]MCF4970132.1 transporter [Nostoc sp. CMAA1605]